MILRETNIVAKLHRLNPVDDSSENLKVLLPFLKRNDSMRDQHRGQAAQSKSPVSPASLPIGKIPKIKIYVARCIRWAPAQKNSPELRRGSQKVNKCTKKRWRFLMFPAPLAWFLLWKHKVHFSRIKRLAKNTVFFESRPKNGGPHRGVFSNLI